MKRIYVMLIGVAVLTALLVQSCGETERIISYPDGGAGLGVRIVLPEGSAALPAEFTAQITVKRLQGTDTVTITDKAYVIKNNTMQEAIPVPANTTLYVTVKITAEGYNYEGTGTARFGEGVTQGVTVSMHVVSAETGTVQGTVTDTLGGASISGATVTSDGGDTTTTNTQGAYTFTVPAGSRTITVTKTGYVTKTDTVNVASGETATLNISLSTATGTLQGTITDIQGGAVISGATVTSDGGETTTTNAQGAYTLAVSPGTRTITVTKSGYVTKTKTDTVNVASGGTATLNITLTASGTPLPGMVFVQGGTFQMGSNDGYSDEQPIHSVTLSSYYIGKYEVTQAEWVAVMGSNPSYFTGDNLPVETVSWYDVVNFCNQKSIHDGLTPAYTINGTSVTVNWSANGYRLPTEAEWEYAARGGNQSNGYTYSGSNNVDDVAWYGFYSGGGTSGEHTNPVGTKSPNELGIYDMSGNVYEWCWDWYDSGYYSVSPSTNPTGPTTGDWRVLRGGSWFFIPENCRVAYRDGDYGRFNSGGLRLAQCGN